MIKENENRLLNLLGIAQRANKLVSGELAVEKFIRSGKAKLVLVAQDASAATQKNYADMAKFYQVKFFCIASKESLGCCIGKNYRASIALSDAGFVKSLLELIEGKSEK